MINTMNINNVQESVCFNIDYDRLFRQQAANSYYKARQVGFSWDIKPCTGIPSLRSSLRNHPSSLTNERVVTDYITHEVATGRNVGPLSESIGRAVHCSPIGLVLKGRQEYQPVAHDCRPISSLLP